MILRECIYLIAWAVSTLSLHALLLQQSQEKIRDKFMACTRPSNTSADAPTRRMILIEDNNPQIAELLGIRLKIPPGFFLTHCDVSTGSNIINHTGMIQGD